MATIISIGKPRRTERAERIGEQAIDCFVELQNRVDELAVDDRLVKGLGTPELRYRVGEIRKSAEALLHTLYILEGLRMK